MRAASDCCRSEDLVGRVDAVVGSWDLAMKDRPIKGLAVRFAAIAVFHRGALTATVLRLEMQHGLERGRVILSLR